MTVVAVNGAITGLALLLVLSGTAFSAPVAEPPEAPASVRDKDTTLLRAVTEPALVDDFVEEVRVVLLAGEKLEIGGFGTFDTLYRRGFLGGGQEVPAQVSVNFRMDEEWRSAAAVGKPWPGVVPDNPLFVAIVEHLASGQKVQVDGLGTFRLTWKRGKPRVHGEPLTLPMGGVVLIGRDAGLQDELTSELTSHYEAKSKLERSCSDGDLERSSDGLFSCVKGAWVRRSD